MMASLLRSCRSYTNAFWSSSPQSATKRAKVICIVMLCLFVLHTLYNMSTYINIETYVWQCVGMGEALRPVRRDSCPVSFAMDATHKKYPLTTIASVVANPNDNKNAKLTAALSNNMPKTELNIALVMIFKKSVDWPEELLQRVIRNRERYCRIHKCKVIVANHLLDKSRPAAWSKLRAVQHYLSAFDYVMYIDTDVVLMNVAISPSAFIALAPKHDFLITEDWNGINSGNWFVKNTPFAHWFLATCWNQTQLIPKRSVDGVSHPFEYEQRAFHYLLNTKMWSSRALPRYPGDSKELLTHFYLLPQCSMNSYVLHPFNFHGDREVSHFVHGDFLVHFAGKKGRKKTDLLAHYLDLADATSQQ